jgi:hypothetical protein
VRLNNFIAPTADLQYERSKTAAAASKFSSTNKRKPSSSHEDEEEDAYDDDFESLSKSQVAVSLAKVKQRIDTGESYSNEQFESMAESKTLSGDVDVRGAITCFVCKQQIPKSQALSH